MHECIYYLLFNASSCSTGVSSIAEMATAQGVKSSRYLADKYMRLLDVKSCQNPRLSYKKGGAEQVDIPHILKRQFAVVVPNQVWCERGCDIHLDL